MDVPQRLIDRISEFEEADRAAAPLAGAVHRVTRRDAVKNALSGSALGHQLHPVLTDLPIGAWTMASALDYFGGTRHADGARRLVALGVLSAAPAAAAGASDWSDSYGGDRRIGLVHGVMNLAATGVHACSWVARMRGRSKAGVALSTIGLALTAGAGYLGGHLSFARGVGVNRTAFEPAVTEWTRVAALHELEERKPLRVEAAAVPVVLVLVDGRVHALSATCTHAGGRLDDGMVIDEDSGPCLVCPLHGSTFRLADGGIERGPAAVPEPRWQVRIDSGEICVSRRTVPAARGF